MSTITQLEYIVAVSEELHFGRAAKRCFVSQPSLSSQIHKLEEELEVTIFDRNKKPISPTEQGALILEQAKMILREHRKLSFVAENQTTTPQGKFKLAVIPTVAQYLIPRFVSHFAQHFPKVKLIIDEYKTDEIIQMLRNDQVDAGLLVTPLNEKDITEKTLFYEKFFAYFSKGHPKLQKKSVSEFDLEQDNMWLLGEGHCFRDQALKVCAFKKLDPPLRQVEFLGGSLETLRLIVDRHEGYTLLPELAVDSLDKNIKQSQVRAITSPTPTREVSLVYTNSFYKFKILSSLQRSILESIPEGFQISKNSTTTVVDI